MSLREIIPLLPEARQSQVKAGQSIFNLGDTGYVMYFILDGEVAITTAENQKIDHLTTGDIFGEMALVDNQVRSANAMALTDITLAIIDQKGFNDLAQQLPTFATDVMAIMSSRLRRYMKDEVKRQRLEEELAIGRQIQLSLLPQEAPAIAGWDFAAVYRAARQVGGDLYDFIPDPDNPDLLHLVIADVTGKGVPAALFMAMCRAIIRAAALNGRSPANLLQRTNHLLMCEQRAWPFLTAFFASLNVQTGQFIFANGGHDRPYWIQANGGHVQQIVSRGMLLGAFPAIHLEEKSITLATGDMVILYTDGITEAHREKELFGDTRLKAVISAHTGCSAREMARAILDAVSQFCDKTSPIDDMTLVVIKRENA
jgi:serine phosphatase RsbU (regulator of sigma subunit)